MTAGSQPARAGGPRDGDWPAKSFRVVWPGSVKVPVLIHPSLLKIFFSLSVLGVAAISIPIPLPSCCFFFCSPCIFHIVAMAAAIPAVEPKKLSGLDLYSRFAFAGAVCCSVTHGALTPVDV